MPEPAYPAARAVAALVEAHFARQHAAHVAAPQPMAPLPRAEAIEALIDIAFWASLRREEGRSPEISLAFLPPERAGRAMSFERALPLTPATLIRLAPAVERPGIHLGVWYDGDTPCLWGATRSVPPLCLVIEVVEPGLVVVKHRRACEFGKFVNVAVLHGDQVRLVDEEGSSLPDCPALVDAMLGFAAPGAWGEAVDVLVQLAVSMRAHRHGGSLLVVPAGSDAWRESIVHPIAYPVAPAFTGVAESLAESAAGGEPPRLSAALQRSIDGVAGLTAVDGATVISDRYALLAFGAKIGRRAGREPVEQVAVTEPVVGAAVEVLHPAQLGGTRHLSAAQFVHDQPDALALVASQDGRFTVFAWSPCEERVHAHRVEVLLM